MTQPEQQSSPFLLVSAWLVVSLPLGWGVYESVKKSLPLFYSASTTELPAPTSK